MGDGNGGVPHHGRGGLRKPTPDSPNGAWRNSSSRGFADCMQTEEFKRNVVYAGNGLIPHDYVLISPP